MTNIVDHYAEDTVSVNVEIKRLHDEIERLREQHDLALRVHDAMTEKIERLRKPLKIEVCKGQAGLALYVNDTRIAGPSHNGRMEAVLTGTYVIPTLKEKE
jgi:predicted  nucleic acid-binding Zn-ribbon protein